MLASLQPSVFVCYAHGDEAVVLPHIDWLESQQVALWFDRGIQGGAIWRNEIGQALERSTHVIFVSRASLASEHCDREVQYAIDHGKKLIPVFIEDVALPAGLSVALGRVQALYTTKVDGATLRGQMLSALGASAGATGTPSPPKAQRARPKYGAMISIAGAIVAVVSALIWWQTRPPPEPELPPIPERSLAVLPFQVMSDDPEARHFADALVEEMLNQLASQRRVKVASRTDAARAANAGARELAASLGVGYVLEGSVRIDDGGYRVTAQLIRGRDGFHQWSQTFAFDRLARVEDAAMVTATSAFQFLDLDVMLAEDRRASHSAAAFDYYAKGVRLLWGFDTGGTPAAFPGDDSASNVDKAIELDPEFGPAYHWRIFALGWPSVRPLSVEQVRAEMRRLNARHLELEPDSPWALIDLADVQRADLDLAAAQRTLERIRGINPNFPWLYGGFARLAQQRGRLKEALDYFKQEFEIEASSSSEHFRYGLLKMYDGRLDQADQELDRAIQLAPRGGPGRLNPMFSKTVVAMRRNDAEEARKRFEAAWSEFGHVDRLALVYLLPQFGRERELRTIMASWEAAPESANAYVRFQAYRGLGEYDEAMKWLRRAVDERNLFVLEVIRLPNAFKEVRDRPDFAELLQHLYSIEISH